MADPLQEAGSYKAPSLIGLIDVNMIIFNDKPQTVEVSVDNKINVGGYNT